MLCGLGTERASIDLPILRAVRSTRQTLTDSNRRPSRCAETGVKSNECFRSGNKRHVKRFQICVEASGLALIATAHTATMEQNIKAICRLIDSPPYHVPREEAIKAAEMHVEQT